MGLNLMIVCMMSRRYTVPINSRDTHFVVQCTELYSGLVGTATAEITAPLIGGTGPLDTSHVFSRVANAARVPPALPSVPAADTKFGLHIKAIAILGDSVLFTAMHVGNNTVCLDASTGKEKWRNRLGHYWAFSPTVTKDGKFAAQGFDLLDSHGMQVCVTRSRPCCCRCCRRRRRYRGFPERNT